jgi:hypothetical protein
MMGIGICSVARVVSIDQKQNSTIKRIVPLEKIQDVKSILTRKKKMMTPQ